MPPNISSSEPAHGVNWLAGVEAAVVFVLIMFYIWWLRFRQPYAWMPVLELVFASHFYHREGLGALGFGWQGRPRNFAKLSVTLALIATALIAVGLVFHTIRPIPWRGASLNLALYCIWGLFQQYVLNGYFVNRFSSFVPNHRETAVPILAGVFFSLAHLPNWFLMVVALAGGYICARIYLRYRNLYVLALAHGIVGFLIYLVVPDTISHHLYVGPKWFSM